MSELTQEQFNEHAKLVKLDGKCECQPCAQPISYEIIIDGKVAGQFCSHHAGFLVKAFNANPKLRFDRTSRRLFEIEDDTTIAVEEQPAEGCAVRPPGQSDNDAPVPAAVSVISDPIVV